MLQPWAICRKHQINKIHAIIFKNWSYFLSITLKNRIISKNIPKIFSALQYSKLMTMALKKESLATPVKNYISLQVFFFPFQSILQHFLGFYRPFITF